MYGTHRLGWLKGFPYKCYVLALLSQVQLGLNPRLSVSLSFMATEGAISGVEERRSATPISFTMLGPVR